MKGEALLIMTIIAGTLISVFTEDKSASAIAVIHACICWWTCHCSGDEQ
jgi:hypothetical protein